MRTAKSARATLASLQLELAAAPLTLRDLMRSSRQRQESTIDAAPSPRCIKACPRRLDRATIDTHGGARAAGGRARAHWSRVMSLVLIVDDNVAFAENLAEIIGDTGDEAVVAASGARALELAAKRRFDVLISDMRMPQMSGGEVVRRMRVMDADLPVIIMTAYTADDELEDVGRAGLLAVLPKPVPLPRLLELLAGAARS
jgi:CheY-like chemotaxis protein